MKKETVLITGGAGFIGSHLADRCIEEGYKVVVVDNLSSGKKSNLHKKVTFYKLDVESSGLESVFQKEHPDYVSHHAAQAAVRHSIIDPLFDAQVNVLGTINVLENCHKYKVKKVIFASSGGAVYGEQEIFPAPENHPLHPLSPYGVSKLTGEHYLHYYKAVHGLAYAALRYANVYGPRQDPFGEAGVVAIFIQKMLNGDLPLINGDGKQTRDFIFIEDVLRANMLAMKSGQSGIFNIGTGKETSVDQIFDHLKNLTHASIVAKHGPAKPGEQRRSSIDPAKAKKWLKWKPVVSLEQGLLKTVDYFRDQL